MEEVERVILLEGVVKRFGNLTAVNKLSFSVKKNSIYGLLGSNGAGKTTTINMLSGLLLPDEGRMTILGLDVVKDIERIRKHIAVVPQSVSLYDSLTIQENLEFFGGMYTENEQTLQKRMEEIISVLKLEKKKDVRVENLSGGYQRRCSIGCALMAKPKILFLDEPLTGIDIATNEVIMNFIRTLKEMTIIFTTHSIKEAESVCDEVLFLDNGREILKGKPEKIVQCYAEVHGEKVVVACKEHVDGKRVVELLKNTDAKNIRVDGNIVSFVSKNIGEGIIEELDALKDEGVVNVDIKKPTLEDIFVHIMGGNR